MGGSTENKSHFVSLVFSAFQESPSVHSLMDVYLLFVRKLNFQTFQAVMIYKLYRLTCLL